MVFFTWASSKALFDPSRRAPPPPKIDEKGGSRFWQNLKKRKVVWCRMIGFFHVFRKVTSWITTLLGSFFRLGVTKSGQKLAKNWHPLFDPSWQKCPTLPVQLDLYPLKNGPKMGQKLRIQHLPKIAILAAGTGRNPKTEKTKVSEKKWFSKNRQNRFSKSDHHFDQNRDHLF